MYLSEDKTCFRYTDLERAFITNVDSCSFSVMGFYGFALHKSDLFLLHCANKQTNKQTNKSVPTKTKFP